MATPGGDVAAEQGLKIDADHKDEFDELDDEQLSPSDAQRRRSTRVSALRAQEKLRGEYKENEEPPVENSEASGKRAAEASDEVEPEEDENGVKKRKLAKNFNLDPTNPHFAIQLADDGEVIVLSDDSEVSSLRDDELAFVRQNYEKIISQELTEEQKFEREKMIRQLQAELRQEEAKLMMLKKLRMSQQMPSRDSTSGGTRPGMNVGRNLNAGQIGAYKPPVAAAPNQGARVGQKPQGNIPMQSKGQGNMQRPPAAHQSSRPPVPPHLAAQQRTTTPPVNQKGAAVNVQSGSAPRVVQDTQTPQQRQAAAKLALRKQLEKTLLQIPPPKPPPPEMHFAPNPNQPEFVYLVGLDQVVQKVKKDRSIDKRPETGPYECTQCSTDFTPVWKAVKLEGETTEDGEDVVRLMCEQCVRTNQKKALKAEHTNRLKQAFVKALQQEQEIEQQIQEGKFNLPPVTQQPAPTTVTHRNSPASTPKMTAAGSSGGGSSANNAAAAALAAATLRGAAAQQQNQAALAAAGLAGLPAALGQFPQLMNMGWNPMLAARFQGAAMAALAQAAANSPPTAFPPGMMNPNMSKDLLKNLQQHQNALQRQLLMEMMPKQSQQKK